MPHQFDSADLIHPPFNMVYTDHTLEISCDSLFGDPNEVDWDTEFLVMYQDGVENYVTPPAGWQIFGWEEYAHKDNAFVISFYLKRNDDADCEICAAAQDY